MKRVCVLVLGDLGRSPRMLYHTLSLANQGYQVDLVGYSGSGLPKEILEKQNITVKHIQPTPIKLVTIGPRIFRYFMKAFLQSILLLLTLPVFSYLDFILVQTPPGIPTLPVLAIYSFLKGTRLVIDFHNYSHTILSMSCGAGHPLVRITHVVEKMAAKLTYYAAFCVTRAMKQDLEDNWGITANVLHDRPPKQFRPISVEEKHELLLRLSNEYPVLKGDKVGSTKFTTVDKHGKVLELDNRPGLVVSSTSWTEDEDFSIFLSALKSYDTKVESQSLPSLICVITGKGDLKEYYLKKISEAGLKHVSIVTPWLEIEDYPRMLASADLGVSLHTSSSGLDLPMKVVDMFGCGLPVAAVNFRCLDELVQDGVNGFVFRDSGELAQVLADWFADFPTDSSRHHVFRENLRHFRSLGWDQNWQENAAPVFRQQAGRGDGASLSVILFFVGVLLLFCSWLPTAV